MLHLSYSHSLKSNPLLPCAEHGISQPALGVRRVQRLGERLHYQYMREGDVLTVPNSSSLRACSI